jgi:uncharacterized protein
MAAERFDAVVLATHADDALACSPTPTPTSGAALGGFEYSDNRVVLHTDRHPAPPPNAWARWNIDTDCRARRRSSP